MGTSVKRNMIGLAAAGFYALCFFVFSHIAASGCDGFFTLLAMHVCYGAVGYFLFRCGNGCRVVLLMAVVIGHGIVTETLHPDPRHELVQVFVSGAFSLVAAVGTWLGRGCVWTWQRMVHRG